ncbi:TRAP transporter substrate-binding protein [Acuticoccus kandeliae]|uniref:TRAP transporter substrate-binding protein n=1 Tax=Acuticoccus kandeliae TaxID=2073160 RepID=UPI000D3E9F53|nr:TRAP transporter substrate-binding protein [Acuticoccus kandeliae]
MTQTTRRRFLQSGAATMAGASALAAPSIVRAQDATVLKVQSAWTASNIFQEMAQQYAERVEAMSGGRLRIDLLPAGAVVQAFQLQDAVADGVLDGGHHVTAYWYGKNKAASLFGTGPVFGTDAAQMLAWIHFGGGKELYRELIEDILGLDLVGFFAMPMPTQPLGWFKKQITSLEDMQGLKYRTVGLATDIMNGIGMSVTQLPGGEIVPALERGVIEAFEFNNPTADKQFGAQDVSKYYMLASYHQAAEFFEIIFNKSLFDSLSGEQQAILEYAAEAASTANYGLAMDRYSADLASLRDESGVNIYRTPNSIMDAQLDSWDTVLEDLTKDEYFNRVVESQKAWSDRVGYYILQNQADYKMAYDHYFPNKLTF